MGRRGWRRLRFETWALRLRWRLARHGCRLAVSAPHGAPLFERRPVVRLHSEGDERGALTLRFGPGVSLGRDVLLEVWAHDLNVLELEAGARLDDRVRVALRGGHVHIGSASIVRESGELDVEGLFITGRQADFGSGAVVHCTQRVELGDRVTLAERCSISDVGHAQAGSDTNGSEPVVDPVEIPSDTLVGPNCVLTQGVRLGEGSIVEPGALVYPGDYPAGWVLAGSPARAIRPLDDGHDGPPLSRLPDRTAR
jgi:acetyltransferase-like isoleucine patch superfamily enzyme